MRHVIRLIVVLSACVAALLAARTTSWPWVRAVPMARYADPWLCFAVDVPQTWGGNQVQGGFATFAPPAMWPTWARPFMAPTARPFYRIAPGTPTRNPNLQQTLNSLYNGPLGGNIRMVEEIQIGQRQAVLFTFTQHPNHFTAIVVTPDCGVGPKTLVISSGETSRAQFEAFLQRVVWPKPNP
ncbi:MAG: hypothetical protein MUD01_06075 [Chloroflexaceae bacterium]|jgi:hypothetical protein|nr:hypothetical protein [Chloroflexaceae bacterium]